MTGLRLGKIARNIVNNDNVISLKRNNNDNVRGRKVVENSRTTRMARAAHVDWIADRLVDALDAPNCRPFFAKCGWNLSEDFIWATLESALKPSVSKPAHYFTSVCRAQMAKSAK